MKPILGFVSVVCVFQVVLAAKIVDDPTCTQPERQFDDAIGVLKLRELKKRGLTYDDKLFEVEQGDSARLRLDVSRGQVKVQRVIFKAAVHTCRLKLMPGVKEWVVSDSEGFAVPLEVAPYSQPSNFNLYGNDQELLLKAYVSDEATVTDINNFLEAHGVYKKGREPEAAEEDGIAHVHSDGSVHDVGAAEGHPVMDL